MPKNIILQTIILHDDTVEQPLVTSNHPTHSDMVHQLRSAASTQGRRMAGARALWRANGMKDSQMGKPIIAIVNSFTQFVPGHTR